MTVALSLIAVVVAVVLPLAIERLKRPSLSLSVGEAATARDGSLKYLHVLVTNRPLESRWLLRNTATGCIASLSFKELGSGKHPVEDAPARWAARPEPVTMFLDAGGSAVQMFDITKLEQSFRLDVSPGQRGEAVAVAVKFNGEPSAYALSKDSYLDPTAGPLRSPKLELAGDEYRLTVRAEAGGTYGEAHFRVQNRDDTLDGFSIQPWED